MSFAPGFAVSPEIFFPQSDSDGTPVCVPDEDFFFYLRPMPAYLGALSILVGIGAGPQFPQSFESDPWQAPIIQQTQNVIAFTPPDQGDMAFAVAAIDDDGYVPRVLWTDVNTLRVVWDDGNAVATIAVVDDDYIPRVVWAEANQAVPVWDDGALSVAAAVVSPEEMYWLPPVIWPSWTPTQVVYDDADIAAPLAPVLDDFYFIPRIVWPSWTPTPVVYDDAELAVASPPILDELYFIPRIVWPSWTPTWVVYDDAYIAQPAVPLLVEWQEWQRPIIWPELPPMVTLQPWLWDSADMFNPFSLHAGLRVTDLGNDRYIVTDAGGNRYLVREWGLPRYGVEDA